MSQIRVAGLRLAILRLILCGFLLIQFGFVHAQQVTPQQIIEAVDQQLEQATADISAWVKIQSVTAEGDPFRQEKQKMLEAVIERANALGLKGWMLNGNQVAVVDLPGRTDQVLGILVHADVVPAGNLQTWEHPPFSGLVKDGELWGRGSLDDKGPIAASLHVMAILKQWGIFPEKTVRLIVGSSEENLDWKDLEAVREAGLVPQEGWTADARFPVINAEKSFVNLVLHFPVRQNGLGAISLEGGTAPNSVPDHALVEFSPPNPLALEKTLQDSIAAYLSQNPEAAFTLERQDNLLKIRAAGKAAHGSRPAEGVNAISHLMRLLHGAAVQDAGLKELLEGYPMLTFLAEKMGLESNGTTLGIYSKGEPLGETTVNLGVVDLIGDETRAHLNIRGPAGLTVEDILNAMTKSVSPYGGRIEIDKAMEPLLVNADAPLIKKLQKAYESATGEPAKILAIGGTTYAKAFPGFVAFGMGMPEDEGLGHAANERLNLQRLRKSMEIYLHALLLLAADIEVK